MLGMDGVMKLRREILIKSKYVMLVNCLCVLQEKHGNMNADEKTI